jgi:hypothetical protein
LVGQDPGTWRASFDVALSRGLSGGHAETHGLSAGGEVIDITPHRHAVELNLMRFELGLSRSFNDTWDAGIRVPYFIKEQTADVAFSGGGSHHDREAARRNGQIHHRTETYEGFGDPEITAGWRKRDLFGEGSVFRFGAGFTVPLGATENDPWLRGDAGLEHLHVQFGNGTFDPVFDAYLGKPINEHLAWGVFGKARLPLYYNDKGYRAPVEVTLAPRLTWLANKDLSISVGAVAQYFGYSDWEQTGRDRNSGLFTTNVSVGAGYKVNANLTASLTALFPVYTDSFGGEDTLEPAPTFSLSLGYSF